MIISLLFFTRGERTENIWYYDLTYVKVTKKKPLTLQDFEEFFQLLPNRADSERSWTVTRQEIEARQYDLKAVNPHAKNEEGAETPEELLDFIEMKGQEVAEALAVLRGPNIAKVSYGARAALASGFALPREG
jgi:type I restriction enzyme M protein